MKESVKLLKTSSKKLLTKPVKNLCELVKMCKNYYFNTKTTKLKIVNFLEIL